jgi:hypothetical protein
MRIRIPKLRETQNFAPTFLVDKHRRAIMLSLGSCKQCKKIIIIFSTCFLLRHFLDYSFFNRNIIPQQISGNLCFGFPVFFFYSFLRFGNNDAKITSELERQAPVARSEDRGLGINKMALFISKMDPKSLVGVN